MTGQTLYATYISGYSIFTVDEQIRFCSQVLHSKDRGSEFKVAALCVLLLGQGDPTCLFHCACIVASHATPCHVRRTSPERGHLIFLFQSWGLPGYIMTAYSK